MATIGKVRAVFTATANGLSAGVNQAAGSMKKLSASAASADRSMRGRGGKQGAKLFGSVVSGVSNAVSSLVRFGQAEAETIDQTSKLAARLGFTYGEMAGFALAGDLAGVSMDTIGAAATKADVAFVKAANGSKEANAAFARLGLSVEQLNGMSAAERFDAITEAIASLPTEAERAAAAVAMFGRSGAQLLPLFAGGAEAIRAAREEAERFGLALTNAQGQNVEAMNDAFTRAQKAVAGVVQQVVAYLAPAVSAVTTAFSDLIGSVGGANIGQAIGEGILQGARFLAQIGDYLIQNFSSVFQYFSGVGQTMSAVFDIGNRVAQAFYGTFKLFEFVGNAVGALLSSVIGEILRSIGTIASYIPGLGSIGDGMLSAGNALAAQSDRFLAAADENLAASGQAFAAAIQGPVEQAGQQMAGPLTTGIDRAIAAAEQAAAQIDTAKRDPVEVKQQVELTGVKEAVKGIDSRSSEGVAEMFRLMRSGGGSVQEQQLSVLEQIAENTSGGDDTYPFSLEGA